MIDAIFADLFTVMSDEEKEIADSILSDIADAVSSNSGSGDGGNSPAAFCCCPSLWLEFLLLVHFSSMCVRKKRHVPLDGEDAERREGK